jgi:hypothetical protein
VARGRLRLAKHPNRLDANRYRSPVLASSTDGVGTKLLIAQAMDVHDTVGLDLVAMVVDDIVACGAEPLFLLDYVACGEVQPDRVQRVIDAVRGIEAVPRFADGVSLMSSFFPIGQRCKRGNASRDPAFGVGIQGNL